MKKKQRWGRGVLAGIVLALSPMVHAIDVDLMTDPSTWIKASWETWAQAPSANTTSGGIDFRCAYSLVPNGSRCSWDKAFTGVSEVDLTGANVLKIKMKIQNVAAIEGMGYYLTLPSLNGSTEVQSLQTARALKDLVEGPQESVLLLSDLTPAATYPLKNLSRLTNIRLSPWKLNGTQQNSVITIESIKAVNVPIVVIEDNTSTVDVTRSMLERYGLDYIAVPKNRLPASYPSTKNPLAGAKIIINNFAALSVAQSNFLASHLADPATGSKLIVYGQSAIPSVPSSPPTALQLLLGLNLPSVSGFIPNAVGMQFTSYATTNLALPAQMPGAYEKVWVKSLTNSVSPATPLAYWVDGTTGLTTTPAWQINSYGAYRDRYLTNSYHRQDDDWIQLALIMQLRPDMVGDVLAGATASVNSVGEFTSFTTAANSIDTALDARPASARKTQAKTDVADARQAYTDAQTSGAGAPFATLASLFEARKKLVHAYSELGTSGNATEVRAVWSHSGLGAYPGDWAATVTPLANAGFTHILSNAARGVNAVYNSAYLCPGEHPTSISSLCLQKDTTWRDQAPGLVDPLQSSIQAAHAKGVKLVVWKNDFSLIDSSAATIAWWNSSGYAQVDYQTWDGQYVPSTVAPSPCAPKVRDLDFNSIAEIAQNYNVDGIQLDFIRFTGSWASYDNYCKAAFNTYLEDNGYNAGPDPLLPKCLNPLVAGSDGKWPNSSNFAHASKVPACADAFAQFRKHVITSHVRRISDEIQYINNQHIPGKPHIELTGALNPLTNETSAQDWPQWAYGGLIDTGYMMAYSPLLSAVQNSASVAAGKVMNLALTDTEIPIYLGLGFTASADDLIEQIRWLRTGYPYYRGFSLFQLDRDFLENMVPLLEKTVSFHDRDGDGVQDDIDPCPDVPNVSTCVHGLTASYFNDSDTTGNSYIDQFDDKLVAPAVLQRVDPKVDFNWGFSSPGTGVNSDYFSARWTGSLLVPAYTGSYEFCIKGDDGVRLLVDNVDLFEYANWKPQDSVKRCESIALTAGQTVPIQVEFFDLTEEAIIQMTWSWPGQVEQVVPGTSLYAE